VHEYFSNKLPDFILYDSAVVVEIGSSEFGVTFLAQLDILLMQH